MTKPTRILLTSLLGFTISASAFAGPDQRHEERKEERHEEKRREDRHEDRREDRHEDRREDRHEDRREDHREGPRGAPPASRFERHENRRGYAWVGGSYQYRGNAYVWEPGRYEAERHGMRWREPRWEVRDGVYFRTDGGWMNDGPSGAPPALREERFEARHGFVYIRGRWNWAGGQYAWTPGHYERERVGHHWREPRWEQRDGVYVSVDGSWD